MSVMTLAWSAPSLPSENAAAACGVSFSRRPVSPVFFASDGERFSSSTRNRSASRLARPSRPGPSRRAARSCSAAVLADPHRGQTVEAALHHPEPCSQLVVRQRVEVDLHRAIDRRLEGREDVGIPHLCGADGAGGRTAVGVG
jgi:hypothetical protein